MIMRFSELKKSLKHSLCRRSNIKKDALAVADYAIAWSLPYYFVNLPCKGLIYLYIV